VEFRASVNERTDRPQKTRLPSDIAGESVRVEFPTPRAIERLPVSWICVHIEHERLCEAVNVTFRNMLIAEYREFGEPKDCRVFREFHTNGSYSYFFSPTAAETFEALLNFWNGFTVSPPTRLSKMALIVGAERSAPRNTESQPNKRSTDNSDGRLQNRRPKV